MHMCTYLVKKGVFKSLLCLCSRQLDSVDISVSSQVSPVYGRPLGDASSVSTYIDSCKRFKSLKPLALLSYRLSVSHCEVPIFP
jgi:hypothetical protein